jgi:hypothetical protein
VSPQPSPDVAFVVQFDPMAAVSVACDEQMSPATHRSPAPQPGAAIQKLQVARQTVFGRLSFTQTDPEVQPVSTESCVHAMLSVDVPSEKHAPSFVPASIGTQN